MYPMTIDNFRNLLFLPRDEIQKCKDDNMYFINKYMKDKNNNPISLNAAQITIIQYILGGM